MGVALQLNQAANEKVVMLKTFLEMSTEIAPKKSELIIQSKFFFVNNFFLSS